MASSAAFVVPSKPLPEFVETFGIALVEKMLSGGGPVITTETEIGEAVGDCAMFVPGQAPDAIAAALDRVCAMSREERADMESRARAHASQLDRAVVFDRLLERLNSHATRRVAELAV